MCQNVEEHVGEGLHYQEKNMGLGSVPFNLT